MITKMGGVDLVMLLVLHFCITLAAAQRDLNTISLGSYLTPTTDPSWFSPSVIFAFGFYQLQPNGNIYAVCISFAGFSERRVVWTANRDNPIVPNNVKLVLTDDGTLNLQQRVSQYTSIINFDIASYSERVGSAAMLDNGNFVLYSEYNHRVIWQSFDHPTDTLLPGQRLAPGGMLLSRASETSFAKGIFTLKMQTDGDLVQYPVDARTDTYEYAYYASNTAGGGFNVSLNLDNDGRLYLLNGSSTVLKNITRGGGGTIHLMRIDVDGIFRLYRQSWDRRGDNNWRSIWSSTEDKCLPKGSCGLNSFCTYLNHTVDCKCLPGFGFVEAGNWTAGCARNFSVGDCDQGGHYEMTRVPNVYWEENAYNFVDKTTEETCGRACLDDCYCDAAIFKEGQCRRQRLPLRYGRWFPIYSSTALVKVIRRSSYNSGSKSGLSDLQKYVVTGASLGIASLVISSIIVYYVVKYRSHNQGQESNQNVDKFILNHGSLSLKRYSHNEIMKMTKSLREKLGQGGYGIVYKGELPDSQPVAVKVLSTTHDNAEDFINEVASISRTSHVNIVNLLGFCQDKKRRALVYEFMPNKSLDKFIYKSTGSVDPERSLSREKLYEIAVGIARGLEYLHRGCNTRIIHFDIKPQNILLDEDFCPKISDFGLAKLVKKKQSKISMLGARGTIGYIAPEVFSRNFGAVSHKSDVYSYGMMLLEMAEARKFAETEATQSSENYFPDKIYEYVLLKTENSDDPTIEAEKEETKRKMLLIGLWCIQTAPSDRPSMTKVVEMLEGSVEAIPIPPKPFLHSPILSGQPFSSSFSVIIETKDVIEG